MAKARPFKKKNPAIIEKKKKMIAVKQTVQGPAVT